MASVPSETCFVCNDDSIGSEIQKVRGKGLNTLRAICVEKKEHALHEKLVSFSEAGELIYVHLSCRRKLTNKRAKKRNFEVKSEEPKKLRSCSTEISFSWKTCCFICAKQVARNNLVRESVHQVQTLELHNSFVEFAQKRGDEWGVEVLSRLHTCIDLVAAEAKYHRSCMNSFRKVKNEDVKVGRPISASKIEGFAKICDWLENESDCAAYCINDLYTKMEEMSSGEVYSLKAFRDKLKKHYENESYIIPPAGFKGEIICFTNLTDVIIRTLKEKPLTKENIIHAAGRLIMTDIKNMDVSIDTYPNTEDIKADEDGNPWIPASLTTLMSHFVSIPLQRVSINQCIVQLARPRSVIAPIPFSVGVSLDKNFASRSLIKFLYRLGFSISDEEVRRFKQSAAESLDEDVSREKTNEGSFVQYVGDNVDHNVATLTGKGTFHGMGIIAVRNGGKKKQKRIKRLKERLQASSCSGNKGIPILFYNRVVGGTLKSLFLKPVPNIAVQNDKTNFCDMLWHCSWFFSSNEIPRPHWSGFMQRSTHSVVEVRTKTDVEFLPIIDMNPNDETCIYSTLRFILTQAQQMKLHTACVTFDQPLWLKATKIAKTENMDMVIRLGGFHTSMNHLGSIGKVMKGSGLEELFEEVYAANTIPHLISGHAFARSFRAHLLAQSALTSLIFQQLIDEAAIDINFLKVFSEKALGDDLSMDDINSEMESPRYRNLHTQFDAKCEELQGKSRTSSLWISYIRYVEITKIFTTAERTSNWQLHLYAISKMLNLFAAAGHGNYARSARLYLQEMQQLPNTHPTLYEEFMAGGHTAKRSQQNWAGISTDLCIEQTLMRSIKSRGGLTQGRGFTENVRHLWVSSLSCAAQVHDAIAELTGTHTSPSNNHIELGTSRTKIDYEDCHKFYAWLQERNPFMIETPNLHSLSTGLVSITGKDCVTCDRAEELGSKIQKSFDNMIITKCSVKRKDLAVPMSSLYNIKKSKDSAVAIESQIMFTRLIAVAVRLETLESAFQYELTPEPMSLFKNGLLRKGNKAQLKAEIMHEPMTATSEDINSCGASIIDGGALLHRVRWQKGDLFQCISSAYVRYVQTHYTNPTIVFDGYQTSSVKDHEHRRRYSVPLSSFVKITDAHTVPYTQIKYFTLRENKTELIQYLSNKFSESGINVVMCRDDADTEIVRLAIQRAKESTSPILVAADDTDVAVMLLYHWNGSMCDVFLLQERTRRWWSISKSQSEITDIKPHLLFLHAWSGCDTTSYTFDKSKKSLVKLLKKSPHIRNASEVLTSPYSSKEEVGEASAAAFKLVYGGNIEETLTKIRYNKYIDQALKGTISPEKLPPTERSAFFHSLRAHYQIMIWSLLPEMQFNPTDWGWMQQDNMLTPISTDMDSAPLPLKTVIRCKCSPASQNPCSTRKCTCRKFGMPCLPSCSGCRGEDCTNCDVYTNNTFNSQTSQEDFSLNMED